MSSRNISKRILIRADSSDGVGTGHLVRSLALAWKLRESGAHVTFACAPALSHVARMVSEVGCELVEAMYGSTSAKARVAEEVLAAPDQMADAAALCKAVPDGVFDWLIVDHYGLDARWERAMRSRAKRILVIDDLTNRPHDCDLLLDQNPGTDRQARHCALSGTTPRYLIGPSYALLRPGFVAARAQSGPRQGHVNGVLVMFGGLDPTDETMKAVKALRRLPALAARIDVVTGEANPRCEAVRTECAHDSRMRFHFGAKNIPELMTDADIAMGACGSSSWERCAVYLPAIVVPVAENQREIATGLETAGAAEVAGWHADVTDADLASRVQRLVASPVRIRTMSERAGKLTDGYGAERVVRTMEEFDAHSRVLH